MKLAVFLPNWLGDLVMATPALRAIRRHLGPDVQITGIIRPHLADVLEGTDWFNELWLFDPRANRPELRRLALLRELRRDRPDRILLLTNSLHTGVLAWLSGAGQRIGYVRYGRGPLLTGKVYPPRRHGQIAMLPMVKYYLRLAEAMGCPPESPRLELAVTEADRLSADRVWHRIGLRDGSRVVLLNSSGAYGPAKLWPVRHVAALAGRIASELDRDVVVLCGPQERDASREAARLAGHPRVFSMADHPVDFGTVKGVMERARLLVSTDSGPRHMAAALGLPVVTLYGPMLPIWAENPTVHAVDVHLNLECLGCGARVCPLKHNRCMQELLPDRVFIEVARVLSMRRADCATLDSA